MRQGDRSIRRMFFSEIQRFFHMKYVLDTLLNDGIELLESGKTEEAIYQLEKCIGLAPESDDFLNVRVLAIVHLGKAHIKEGRFEEAVRVFHLVPSSSRLNKEFIDRSDVQVLLQTGVQHLGDENYQKAILFFHGVRVVAVDRPSVLKAEVGLYIAIYQKERKSSTWLASKLNEIVHDFLSLPMRSNILQEFCEVLFTMGKKKKSKQDYSTSVRDLAAAYELCSHLPTKESKELYKAINQCFIKVYVKLNDGEKALKKFEECMNLEKNFYKQFWKSEECKAKQELAKYRDKALGRFWMLSILTPALPNDVTLLPVAINMHLTLYKMKRDSNALEDALSCLQNVTSYLEAHAHSDEHFAKEMKSFGNCLSKENKTLEAKRVYSFALSAAPKNGVVLRRDLFSNRAYMNQLLGKNEDAVRDARACVELCPQWPKGYLRLAVAQREQKQFKEAHNALLKCFQFSPVTEQPNLLVHIFKNILDIDTEKERQKFKLPSDISINAINNCVAKLAKEQSPIAFDVIRYIFKESKYADYANAGPVDVVRMMQKDCSPHFIRCLISRGANSSQPLNHLLKSDSRTEEQREILMFLIEQDIDLSRYIKAIPNEPPSFMFVRFCLEYNLLDILSNVVDKKDFSVKDGNGNNILHVLMKMEDSNNVYRCINLVLKRVAVDPKETNKDGLKPSQLSELVSDKRVTLLEEFERDGRSGKKNKKKKNKNSVESPVESLVASTSEIPRNEATSINSLQIADDTQKLTVHGPNEDNQLVMKAGPSLPSLYEQSRKTVTDCIRSFKMEAVEKKPESDVIHVIKDKPVPEERPVVDTKLVAGNEPVRKDGEVVDEKPVGENRPVNEEKPAAIQSAGSRPSANGNEYSGRDSLLACGYDDEDQDFETNNDFKQLNVFEGLPWDVQCTSEFWKKLKNPKLAETLKKKLLIKIKLLASGEWRKSLAIKLEGAWCSSGIRLYKCKVTKAARMIWEEAIAFSERRSLDQGKNVQGNSQFVYADVIRLWDFTVDHDEVATMINRVAESRIRGKSCSFKKKLTKVEVKSVTETSENIRLPNLYKSRNCVEVISAERSKQKSLRNFTFFPSASPNDDEYHILKFYALSSAMAKSVLQNCEQDFDFPFQVSELEYCIIRLNPVPLSSILLLGRSGTGKTTCCVYRLWSKFKTYWENAVTAGPHIPILQRLVNVESEEKEDIAKNENDMAASPRKVSRSEERVMSCGCMGICMCALAAARAANPSIYADEDVESETIETKSSAHPVTEGIFEYDERLFKPVRNFDLPGEIPRNEATSINSLQIADDTQKLTVHGPNEDNQLVMKAGPSLPSLYEQSRKTVTDCIRSFKMEAVEKKPESDVIHVIKDKPVPEERPVVDTKLVAGNEPVRKDGEVVDEKPVGENRPVNEEKPAAIQSAGSRPSANGNEYSGRDSLLACGYDDEDQDFETNNDFKQLNVFEGLPWDVQCTSEFWKKLKNPKLAETLKKKLLIKIKLLASGEWRKSLAIKLEGAWCSSGIRLYKCKVTKAARMIWEEAIAFSERRSLDQGKNVQGNSQFVYADVIRLWDFTVDHDEVATMINRVAESRIRGKSCSFKKKLTKVEVKSVTETSENIRLPNLYKSRNCVEVISAERSKQKSLRNFTFFPSASPNDDEYHILKFYALSSAMAKSVLQNCEQDFDFPFQVSELEYCIIRLNPVPLSSILLLGRSGTGKTTCCVYRLWSKFKTYWENAVTAGPHIPILQRLVNVESEEKEDIAKNENDMAASPRKVSRSEERVMSCGCMGICMCALAAARAANPSIYADEDVESETIETKSSAHPVTEGPSDVGDERSSPSLVEDHENERYRHLRQLFVTKNKVLCHEVRKNFKELCSGLPVSIDHVSFQNEVAIENLNKIHHLSYPLFLGSRDLLLALDATLPGKPFFARDSDGKLLTQVAGWGEKESHLAFLPKLDSESEDEDSDVENDDESIAPVKDKRPKSMRQVNSVKREVSYLIFANEVWPLIEKKTVSSYHPSLVWTEFCSFIKGSFASLTSPSGCLTKEQYESIGRKKAPSFTGNRDIIYKMFAKYQRICRDRNLFDEFDFLFNVYKRLSKNPIQPWLFDEIYVDETQDFTEAELFTLIRCCQDPNRLFFTGDTAQSIMRGVTFRFSDLISLFLNAKEALGSVKKYPIQVPDRVHQLTFNYRSHKGILNLASSIVKLLHFFFPESFDHLRDDVGLFDGPKPVILETSDFGDLALMLRGNRRKTSPIEFGAHQVVLVASEASKDKLPEELTDALVLTIYEAKGLEFDDVLLYNFFNDSQAGKEWRVINTYVVPESTKGKESEENGNAKSSGVVSMTESDLALESRPLEFDYNKHKILNSELKQLYTALTRARVNVWIYDEDREKRAPMFSFFKKQGLANTLKLDENQSDSSQENGMFAVKSSITDWEKRGEYFYKKELWSVAYKCFAKTEDKLMLRKCSAHLQAMKSYKMGMDWRESRTGSLKSVYTEYLAATAMYLECGMAEEAIICLRNAKEWKLLGDLLFSLGKYLDAGKYYAKASDSPKDNSAVKASAVKASECYEVIGDYRSAADILYKKEKYQECIQVLKRFETKRSNNNGMVLKPPRSTLSVEKVVKEAADICAKKRDFDNLKGYLKELPLESQLEYLRRKRGCRDIELEVLIENGRGEEAAEIYIQNGEHLKAADCSKEDTTRGICYLEQARSIWNDIGQAISANLQQQKYKQVKQFVDYAVNYLPKDDTNLADCHFLNGLVSEDRSKSLIEAADVYRKNDNNIGVLLCHGLLLEEGKIDSDVIIESLDKMFRQLANIHVSKKAAEVFKLVQQFFGIVKVARDGATFEFRVNKSKIQFRLQILGSPAELEAIKWFDNLDEENGTLDLISALFLYVEDIAAKLFQFYESELERLSFCSQFLQGTSHANCQMMHLIPDGEFAQQRLNLYFSLIQLQGLIRKHITSLVKSKYLESKVNNHQWLSMYNAEMEMVKTCKELYQEIIALYKYLNVSKFTGLQLVNSLPDMPFVKEQIQWCLKMMFRGDKKYKDVNIFLETFTMSNFARLNFIQYEVDAISEDIKQRYKETVPIDEPGLRNNREHRIECFHTIFMESWQWLHSEGALIESIHYLLRRALPLLVTKHVIMPTLKNCLSLLEFSLTLSLISLCRTSSTNRKRTWIYIPAFYIEGLQFWCGIYESCNKPNYSVWDSIEYVSVQKGRSYVISLVKWLIDFILTTKSGKLDLFSQAFGRTSVESGDSQQFLILVLVLLANEELISSIENGYRDVAKLEEGLKSLWRKLMSVTSNAETTEDRVTISLKNAALCSQDNAYKLLSETTEKFGSELMNFNWRMICDLYTPKQRKVENIASKERRFLQKEEIKPPRFRQEATTMGTSKEHQSNNVAEVNQDLLQNTKVIDAATEQTIFSRNTSDAAVVSKPLADDTKASRADRTDDFTVISTAAEHNETKILMREVSYEDQTLALRDPSAQVKAIEERRTRDNDAARKIQSWWRRVGPNNEKAFGGSEKLEQAEEHCSKYFVDLKCVPAAEHNETKILMREVSYEDQTLALRDPSAQVKASEERRTRQNDAARKIQSWWRRVRPNYEKAFGGSGELEKAEEHFSKYFLDLKCVPCGIRFSSRKDVDQHILSDQLHERHAADYDKYISYKQSVSVVWLNKADDLLDLEIQGQKVSTLPNISTNLSKRIAEVSMEENSIEKLHQWKELPKLKECVTALQRSHFKLLEKFRRSEENDDENYNNDGDYSFRDDDNYDDFEMVTGKRKSKRWKKVQHALLKKRQLVISKNFNFDVS
ncbi:uncharacterized protein LOC135691969 [Rhopilema esculentum]|uniref:uncharacterized protein LOC135691969 n=1 Tax=Rhopilema esculentum TaxID=499914 RepID=UPI0031D05CE4